MISEERLQTWANTPSATKYKYTHEEIRKVLAQHLPDTAKNNHGYVMGEYDVYLQGSYANNTNITGESDVDIVIELKSTFSYDTSKLTALEKQKHEECHPSSNYNFISFKKDVHEALNAHFGNVEYAKKCLKIPKSTDRVNADVVPCFEHREYERFLSLTQQEYIPGIKFYNTETNEEIINYPSHHKANCEVKNKNTEGNYKRSVRIFKNFKKELVSNGAMDEKVAPSYFIENMLYNCTPQCFNGNYTDIVLRIFQFISNDMETSRISSYLCANERHLLFDEKTWNIKDATAFISGAAKLFLQTP